MLRVDSQMRHRTQHDLLATSWRHVANNPALVAVVEHFLDLKPGIRTEGYPFAAQEATTWRVGRAGIGSAARIRSTSSIAWP